MILTISTGRRGSPIPLMVTDNIDYLTFHLNYQLSQISTHISLMILTISTGRTGSPTQLMVTDNIDYLNYQLSQLSTISIINYLIDDIDYLNWAEGEPNSADGN